MRKRNHKERGQAAVEFTLLAVMLILASFLVLQLTWLAIQKWQFNHFASYSARSWSVQTNKTPGEVLFEVIMPGAISRWDLWSRDYVKLMWVSSEDPVTDEETSEAITGVTYSGVAPLFAFYQPVIGETFLNAYIPGWVFDFLPFDVPSTGLVAFETFIPMEREPYEEPDRSDRDNDCRGTPCEGGNGR